LAFAEKEGLQFKVSDTKYKVVFRFIEPESQTEVEARILQDAAQTRRCIDFIKTEGEQFDFLEKFNTIKKYFGCPSAEPLGTPAE